MDRDKEDPYVRFRFSEIVRFVFYVAVVIFLLSSVVLVAVDYVQIKQRLAAIEEKINADELLRKVCVTDRKQTEIDGRAEVQASLSRRRKALTLSLAGLEKRVKVLEYRWGLHYHRRNTPHDNQSAQTWKNHGLLRQFAASLTHWSLVNKPHVLD